MTIQLYPGEPKVRGDAPELPLHERSRYRAAAGHARRVYPGPLGELVFRELSAYAEFGHRFDIDGLIPRLATLVLAVRSDHHLDGGQAPLEGTGSGFPRPRSPAPSTRR